MRAHLNDRDRNGRRHAIFDEDFWAYAGHADVPLLTACHRDAGEHVGEFNPAHPDACPKCVKIMTRYGLLVDA